MTTKTADSKGRITLGERFANRTVIVEEVDETEVRITLARVIPERELWLHENTQAKARVARGLEEASTRAFAEGAAAPDMDAARKLAERIGDED